MKVVCIENILSNGYKLDLTIGKTYDVVERNFTGFEKCYWVTNDIGSRETYTSIRFITLEEFRNNKINDIFN